MRKTILSGGGRSAGRRAAIGESMGTNAFRWNEVPVKGVKLVNYVVQPPDGEIEISEKSWIWPFVGRTRQGIVIQAQRGEPFMIDNEDGQGYLKLANGGTAGMGHKPAVGKIVEELDWSQCITCFRPDVYRESIVLNLDKMNEWERAQADVLLKWLDDFEKKEGAQELEDIKKLADDLKETRKANLRKAKPPVSTPRIKTRFIKRQLKHEQYKNKNG